MLWVPGILVFELLRVRLYVSRSSLNRCFMLMYWIWELGKWRRLSFWIFWEPSMDIVCLLFLYSSTDCCSEVQVYSIYNFLIFSICKIVFKFAMSRHDGDLRSLGKICKRIFGGIGSRIFLNHFFSLFEFLARIDFWVFYCVSCFLARKHW
jgi:hypothetical protein